MDLNNNQNLSDRDLLRECLEGKEWAWQIFHERFARLIRATVIRTAISHRVNLEADDRKDCEQLIWASFLENDCKRLRSYRGTNGCTLATWLRTCSVHATINFLTSFTRHQNLPLEDNLPDGNRTGENPEHTISRQETWERIRQIMEKSLSGRERLFATLYWVDEVPLDEISRIMHLSVSNLYVVKHRTQKKIKQLLKEK